MPERERRERKLSDEVPGKAPRLNSAVGRTEMEMQNAKTSGTPLFSSKKHFTLLQLGSQRGSQLRQMLPKLNTLYFDGPCLHWLEAAQWLRTTLFAL